MLLVIRTRGNPLRSLPSAAVLTSVLNCALIGFAIPFTGLGAMLGFVTPSATMIAFTLGVTTLYLLAAEVTKRVIGSAVGGANQAMLLR